jgi:hypothetical protein
MAFEVQQIFPIDFNKSAAVGIDFLEDRINSDLELFFPNIQIINLEILRNSDNNSITISLSYKVLNTNINDTIEIDFE